MAAENRIQVIVEAEVAKALGNLKQFQDQSTKTGTSFLSAANVIKGALTGVVAVALQKAIKLGAELIDISDDLKSQFGDMGDAAIEARDKLVGSFGLSLVEATKFLGTTGRLAQSLGFTSKGALDLAENIAKLSVKIQDSSTSGVTAAQVQDALNSALRGRTQALGQLGIVIKDVDIEQEAANRGLTKAQLETNKAARAQIVYDLALKQSRQSLEAASISSLSFAERTKRLANFGENVASIFGAEIVKKLDGASESLLKFSTSAVALETVRTISRKVIESFILFGSIVAAVPLALTTGLIDVGTAIFQLGKGFVSLGNVVKSVLSGDFTGAFSEFKKIGEDTWKGIKENATASMSLINAEINNAKSLFGKAEEEKVKAKKNADGKIIETNDATNYALLDANAKAAAENTRILEEETKKKVSAYSQAVQAFAQSASAIGDFITQVVNNQAQAELDAIKKVEDEKRAQVEKDFENGKITEEQKKAQLEAIAKDEEEKSKDAKKRMKEAAIAQKAIAITQSIINTAAAVVAALVNPVPFVGPALAIAAGITGAAQTALIAAQPIPEFAKGGITGLGGPQLISTGERGPEAILPADLTALLLDAAGQGSTTNNDNKNVTLVANGIQDPVAFINKAQRELGYNAFGGAR